MKNQIKNYIRAGYPGIFITTHEEARAEGEIEAAVKELDGFELYAWSITQGIVSVGAEPKAITDTETPEGALEAFASQPPKSVLVLRDFHAVLREPYPPLVRRLKDCLTAGKMSNRHIIIIGCELRLPPEIEKEIVVLDFKLPDRAALRVVAENIAASANIILNGETDPILDAASGLTTMEAENAFALSVIESGTITPKIVQREKSATIKKNGILEVIDSMISLDDIGGLELLKADLMEKRHLFTTAAQDYGIPTPRGLLAVGQAGTGKSLTAQATASVFNIPLLRLEAGKLFGSLVGQSESNWRNAIATAKAIAPCVLWIDEVDGLFVGAESSGKTDSGVTARVIKAVLQDMQYNSEGIFYIFTANDIDGLPDPLIDRLDTWSVDLPNHTERKAIWRIHIAKRRKPKTVGAEPKTYDPCQFDLSALSSATDGFSGRQIEQVWLKAMTAAFNAKEPTPTTAHCLAAAGSFTATSKTMAEAIDRRRKRLKDRAMTASAPEKTPVQQSRKLAK